MASVPPDDPPTAAELQGLPRESVIDFVPDSNELAELRDHTQATLARWGLDPVAEVACLLVNELATNAIVHTQRAARLRLAHDEALRIAVTDTDPVPPTVRQPSIHDRTGGRGLVILSRLADHWNYTADGDGGKTVWCTVRLD